MKNPFVPTSRDKAMIRFLYTYALARTNDLAAEFFPGTAITTVLRRLRRLEQLGFIARIGFLEFGQAVWRVTESGARLVVEQSPRLYFSQQNIAHDLEVAATRRDLERAKVALAWEPEHLIRSRLRRMYMNPRDLHKWTIPDGIMTVWRKGKESQIAIEVELNFKNRGRYSKILWDYSKKDEFVFVWYLVATPAIGKVLIETWKEISYPSCSFAWSLLEEVKKSPWNSTLYYRDGSCLLSETCGPKPETAPAQAPAQSLSGSASS